MGEIFKMKCMSFSQKYFSLVFKKRKRKFSALEGFASLQIMFRTAGGEARADRFFRKDKTHLFFIAARSSSDPLVRIDIRVEPPPSLVAGTEGDTNLEKNRDSP